MSDKPAVNQGDDISGVVHEVGEGVSEFQKGDRVMAFHEMMKPGGSYAEYALSWASTTVKLPPSVSFEGRTRVALAGIGFVLTFTRGRRHSSGCTDSSLRSLRYTHSTRSFSGTTS